jgi:heme/copper-type cytochrome/quinol oxidase subunit 2
VIASLVRYARAAAFAATLLSTRLLLACPLCADNLTNDVYGKQTSSLGRGFFWSIMLMIAAPFLTVTIVAVKLILARRRARRSADGLRVLPDAAP